MIKKNIFNKNTFNFTKIKNSYFLSTDLGNWTILSKAEFDLFSQYSQNNNQLSPELEKKLVDNFFIFKLEDKQKIINNHINKYLYKFTAIEKYNAFFSIGLTNKCNLNCTYCYSRTNSKKTHNVFSAEIIDKIIDFILSSPSKNIFLDFQGGEPLIEFNTIKKFISILNKKNIALNKKFNFTIPTNGTLLNQKIIDFIKKNDVAISCSIDGNKIIHDKQRPFVNGEESFEKVFKNFYSLKSQKSKVDIISVITQNSKKFIKEIIDFHVKNGSKVIILPIIMKLGRASDQKNWADIGLSNEEHFTLWRQINNYIFELNKKGIIIIERDLGEILNRLYYANNPSSQRSPCSTITKSLSFDSDGNIYPCDEARAIPDLKLGNVKTDDFKSILLKDLSQNIINSTILEGHICNYCAYKPFCGLCPILSFQETNELVPRIWKQSSKCYYFRKIFDFVVGKIINNPSEIFSALYIINTLNQES